MTRLSGGRFHIPEDPYEQLLYSIVAVFRSWNSPVARKYRELVNISDEWGTAVIIQNMVFGNSSPDSVTGVVHSRYHGNEKIDLFGEYKTSAQGHDIVSGVARVFPISEDQKKVYQDFRRNAFTGGEIPGTLQHALQHGPAHTGPSGGTTSRSSSPSRTGPSTFSRCGGW